MTMNKVGASLVILIGIFFSALSHAEGRDGHWWNQKSESQKLTYIAGFFDGTSYSETVLTMASLIAMQDPKTGKFNSKRAEVIKSASLPAIEATKSNLRNLTAGQLVDGLNQTYGDYRNQGISIVDCIEVVIYGIKGATEEQVTHLLEVKRKASSQ